MAKKQSDAFSWLGSPIPGQPADGSEDRARDESAGGYAPVPGVGGRAGARGRGRARTGKRSDPNYVMAGAYVERGVRERVDTALVNLREPGQKKPEYSDLVQSLLVRWLEEVGEDAGDGV